MLEWLKRHAWKACIRQKRIPSSNLGRSAGKYAGIHNNMISAYCCYMSIRSTFLYIYSDDTESDCYILRQRSGRRVPLSGGQGSAVSSCRHIIVSVGNVCCQCHRLSFNRAFLRPFRQIRCRWLPVSTVQTASHCRILRGLHYFLHIYQRELSFVPVLQSASCYRICCLKCGCGISIVIYRLQSDSYMIISLYSLIRMS